MGKSVYSVVLADEVVREIDRLAYKNGTNRSNMINRILADYASLTTAEKRISDIFDELAARLYSGENFRELAPPTQSVMSLRSALEYKYNPTIRYSVELYGAADRAEGALRVSMRTTNAALLADLLDFWTLWVATERAAGYEGTAEYVGGVFKRQMVLRRSPFARGASDGESTGEAIASYISFLDGAIKTYFAGDRTAQTMRHAYGDYLRSNGKII